MLGIDSVGQDLFYLDAFLHYSLDMPFGSAKIVLDKLAKVPP
jgi:hypothetical protein